MKTVSVLGATGSIGDSTLDVVARHPERYRVHTLTACRNVDKLLALAQRHRPEVVAIAHAPAAAGWPPWTAWRASSLCHSSRSP